MVLSLFDSTGSSTSFLPTHFSYSFISLSLLLLSHSLLVQPFVSRFTSPLLSFPLLSSLFLLRTDSFSLTRQYLIRSLPPSL
ncbi:uncharacterized protein BDW47DRAFT_114397 [Aspergillus candidus]|uniref:Uncharacterized protein n=1 Tax=Aspergillus candidus TaxID=41067 RepID=A0A2I2EXX1_ASPCN|nr:hypothetical protein BDW47DRAFT_114397 [Aspergillus candidus]PLB33220.1 hypothetical protein BDW47DRAFT_114397 [Aspergillus candidus]